MAGVKRTTIQEIGEAIRTRIRDALSLDDAAVKYHVIGEVPNLLGNFDVLIEAFEGDHPGALYRGCGLFAYPVTQNFDVTTRVRNQLDVYATQKQAMLLSTNALHKRVWEVMKALLWDGDETRHWIPYAAEDDEVALLTEPLIIAHKKNPVRKRMQEENSSTYWLERTFYTQARFIMETGATFPAP